MPNRIRWWSRIYRQELRESNTQAAPVTVASRLLQPWLTMNMIDDTILLCWSHLRKSGFAGWPDEAESPSLARNRRWGSCSSVRNNSSSRSSSRRAREQGRSRRSRAFPHPPTCWDNILPLLAARTRRHTGIPEQTCPSAIFSQGSFTSKIESTGIP